MTVHHQDPSPRIVFQFVPEDVLQLLVPFAATAIIASSAREVHQSEVDLVITFADDASEWDAHLPVLSFGASELDRVGDGTRGREWLYRNHETSASEMTEPEGLDPEATRLIRTDLVPRVGVLEHKRTWRADFFGRVGDLGGTIKPLLHLGPERFVVALEYMRSEAALCIGVPPEARDFVGWTRYMLQRMQTLNPTAFPGDPDWVQSVEWAVPEVRSAVLDRDQIEVDRRLAEADFAAKIAAAEADLAAKIALSNSGVLMALTEKGEPLVQAVVMMLNDLGLVAQDMDESHVSKTGRRLEDIRVTDPSDDDWLCLVEVKGYDKGTKTNDVAQITGQPCTHLALSEHRQPSAVWFVTNQWRTTPPNARPSAFPNPELDLASLVDFDGAGMDTRDLYRAWRDMRIGAATAEQVRASLKAARGLWTWAVTGDS